MQYNLHSTESHALDACSVHCFLHVYSCLSLIHLVLTVDIDECTQDNGSCDQICTNIDGSFFCDCDVGYQLVDGLCQGDPSLISDN